MSSSIIEVVLIVAMLAWGAAAFWVIGLRPELIVRSRARGKVLGGVYLAILISFYSIPAQLVFGRSETRRDRLYGTWIGLAIILPVYAAGIVLSIVSHS